MPQLCSIKCAVFDMAGTTVDDMIDGEPLVSVAMRAAFAEVLPDLGAPGVAEINAVRGLEKREALALLYQGRVQSKRASAGTAVATAFDLDNK